MRQLEIEVHGRVQGVGFRYHVLRAAKRMNLHGWVRNSQQGTVEIRVRGEDDALDAFVQAVRKGPLLARVSRVDMSDQAVDLNMQGFEITY